MAEKGFGVKEVNLIGASGTPTITSPNNLNLNAVNVAISTNATVGGTLSVTGSVSIGGTLTYEDVTNIDSVGIITARAGIQMTGGSLFVGGNSNFTGTLTGTATTAVTVRTSDESSDTTCFPVFANAAAGDQYLKTGTNLAFNSSNGTLTATTFSGSGASLTNLPAANITGTLPAISGANLTNLPADTPTNSDIQVVYTVTANGSSAYRFAGNGIVSTEDNPDVYLIRGFKYRFINNSGGSHPFQIRGSSGGSAYSSGVTNNGASSGNIDFQVPYSAPSRLYYQCTAHPGMVGNIYIRGANGQNDNVGVTTFSGDVTLSSGNKLLIGTTTEGEASADDLTIANSSHGGLTIRTGTTSWGSIFFSDGTSGAAEYDGSVEYLHGGSSENYMRFRTAGSERFRIDSNGNVNIGSAAPRKRLDITGPDGRSGASPGNSDTALVIDNNGGNGAIMEFLSDNNAYGRIFFTDTDASNQGQIVYEHGGDAFQFSTAGTEKLRISSGGEVTIPNQPSFAARMSSNFSYPGNNSFNSGTSWVMPFDTEVWDIGGNFNTSNYTFTTPVTGRYLVCTTVQIETITNWLWIYIYPVVTGTGGNTNTTASTAAGVVFSDAAGTGVTGNNTTTAAYQTFSNTLIMNLTAGQEVRLGTRGQMSGTIKGSTETQWTMQLLG